MSIIREVLLYSKYQFRWVLSERVGRRSLTQPTVSSNRCPIHKPIGCCPWRRSRLEIITSHHDDLVVTLSGNMSNNRNTNSLLSSSSIVAGGSDGNNGY